MPLKNSLLLLIRMSNDQVAIIGAGATGLAAALWLEDHTSIQYHVFEQQDRAGGKVVTTVDDGFIIEGGADSYLERKIAMTDLIKRVGLEEELVRNEVGQAYILKNGDLYPNPKRTVLGIPTDLDEFMKTDLISDDGKKELLKEYNKPMAPRVNEDISLGDFFEHRLGKEMVSSLIEPLLGGIYGGNIYELSMRATFPHFLKMEEEGSLLRALEQKQQPHENVKKQGMFLTVKTGLQSVFEAVVANLKEGSVSFNTQVEEIVKEGDNRYLVCLANGEKKGPYHSVLITTPPQKASELIPDNKIKQQLQALTATSCATVALTFPEYAIDNPHEGTGFVVARNGQETITACTWTDVKWPHTGKSGKTLMRAYVGKPDQPEIVHESDESITNAVLADLKGIMNSNATPERVHITRWYEAMPQYKVGHVERVKQLAHELTATHPGLHVAGAAFEGVGVPDCVKQGNEVAKKIVDTVKVT
ncbi:protoporphyrinogen oxidase [Shouchella miscanthi]|uniref:Coproporphyrinogen III oxidase n=1 Tax=Shouchella miscanthi TaxID=2598861 RepID=A0ABU6NS18_9BACI|nr:protoporphyrinogen oxidase [Shouchella miscanthi]MED4129587.1 protoporphyrinogen oxidase [Shouchella miscanthi]